MTAVLFIAMLTPLAGAALALAVGRRVLTATWLGAGSAVVGSVVGVIFAAAVLLGDDSFVFRRPWNIPFGEFYVSADYLTALFLWITFTFTGLAAFFGGPYLIRNRHHKSVGAPWFFFNVLLSSMVLLLVARNAMLFLMAWEMMALSSYFLVTHEHQRAEVRNAGCTWPRLT